jgi:hypothetical protein
VISWKSARGGAQTKQLLIIERSLEELKQALSIKSALAMAIWQKPAGLIGRVLGVACVMDPPPRPLDGGRGQPVAQTEARTYVLGDRHG